MKSEQFFSDYHVHTSFSDDSVCAMEDMIHRAIQLGMNELAFTEHVDYGVKTDLNCDYERYFQMLHEMQAKYADVISIKMGIEFGVQLHTIELFNRDFEAYPFDFVILSNHQIDNKEFWNYAYQEGKQQEEFQYDYYRALYEVIKIYKNYSVLGHLDMIKRYDKYGDFPDDRIMKYVEPILNMVIKDGKGIEINTSSFKYGLKDLMPSRAILKRYRELGGEVITIGSDTHETEHLADHIPEVKTELRKLGFDRFCTFDKMKPVYHEL